jgi:hypothetical protein
VQYHVKLTYLSFRIYSVDLKFFKQRDFTLENAGWRIFPTYCRSYIVEALLVSQDISVGFQFQAGARLLYSAQTGYAAYQSPIQWIPRD